MNDEQKIKESQRLIKLIKVVALTNLLMEHWEVFSSDKFVRQSLKRKANMFIKELERCTETPINELYSKDEELFTKIQNSLDIIMDTEIIDILKKSMEIIAND